MDFFGSGEVVQPNLKGLEAHCSLSSVAADGSYFSCKVAGCHQRSVPEQEDNRLFACCTDSPTPRDTQ